MNINYLVVNSSTDPYYNLALEEVLLKNYREGVIVMFWQNEPVVVVGQTQNTVEEINQQYVKEHGIKVARRMTGGGAVYHDLGNLNYSIIMDYKKGKNFGIKNYAEPIMKALRSLGTDARFSGRNDIVIGEKKVSGTAQRIWKERLLHHGCLLFESDLGAVSDCLKVRPEKFESKSVKSVRSRVGNIKDYLEDDMTMEEFQTYLISHMFEEEYALLELSEADLLEAEKLKREKYETWEWIYGRSMKCTVHNYKRYPGGTVEVYMNIQGGKITQCIMYGDFMALRPAAEAAEKLVGCRYLYEDILEVISEFHIWEYFGEITAEEVARSICCSND